MYTEVQRNRYIKKLSKTRAEKALYESCWKAVDRCLVVPHDKYLGEEVDREMA